jgi:predicted glutamine amidotransferase
MCKLFIATGSFTQEQTLLMLRVINTRFASTQRDGFGITLYGDSGATVAHGRYLNPSMYSEFGSDVPWFVDSKQKESGKVPNITTAIIAHGRTSTNKVTIHNCHPFKNDNIMLAHNGVLDWTGSRRRRPKAKHGCDSEQFLTWLSAGRRNSTNWIEPWLDSSKKWSGYGVFGVLDIDRGELVVAKCRTGSLHWSGIGGVNIFSTVSEDVEAVAGIAHPGISKRRSVKVRPGSVIVYNVKLDIPKMTDHTAKWDGFEGMGHDSRIAKSRNWDNHYGKGSGDLGWRKNKNGVWERPSESVSVTSHALGGCSTGVGANTDLVAGRAAPFASGTQSNLALGGVTGVVDSEDDDAIDEVIEAHLGNSHR